GKKFFTLYSEVAAKDELILARIGANDPKYNLRHDPAFILRRSKSEQQTLFLSALELHGSYSPVDEIPLEPFGSLARLETLHNDDAYTVVRITHQNNTSWTFCLANQNPATEQVHSLELDGQNLEWQGSVHMIKSSTKD
ncbi:MAG: heparinase, partial [Bacteroidota bacterium]